MRDATGVPVVYPGLRRVRILCRVVRPALPASALATLPRPAPPGTALRPVGGRLAPAMRRARVTLRRWELGAVPVIERLGTALVLGITNHPVHHLRRVPDPEHVRGRSRTGLARLGLARFGLPRLGGRCGSGRGRQAAALKSAVRAVEHVDVAALGCPGPLQGRLVMAGLLHQLDRHRQALDHQEEQEEQEPSGGDREIAVAQLAERLEPDQDAVGGLVLQVVVLLQLVLLLHRRIVFVLYQRPLVQGLLVPVLLSGRAGVVELRVALPVFPAERG